MEYNSEKKSDFTFSISKRIPFMIFDQKLNPIWKKDSQSTKINQIKLNRIESNQITFVDH